ncbi:MAG: hypothetical protein ACRDXX_03100 [Stackebrandtia sp.]
MTADDPGDSTARELASVRRELRQLRDEMASGRDEAGRSTMRSVLGATGVALWIAFSLPWIDGIGIDAGGEYTIEVDETVSGWGLLGAGLAGLGGEHPVIAFIVGVTPPAAALTGLAAIVVAVARVTGRTCRVAAVLASLAGLGHCGLYLVGATAADDADWSFGSAMFAGLALWFFAAGLASRLRQRVAPEDF